MLFVVNPIILHKRKPSIFSVDDFFLGAGDLLWGSQLVMFDVTCHLYISFVRRCGLLFWLIQITCSLSILFPLLNKYF